MSISVETILADARKLASRLREHDTSTDHLISRTQGLQKQLDAMKQFQESLNELNEVARHRPRLGLIITLAQENSKIRELQQENKELRQSLDDHQSALELIMRKYREQMNKLSRANQVERGILQCSSDLSEDVELKSDKITEMASVMWRAATMDEQDCDSAQLEIKQLEVENQLMRQLLEIELNSQETPAGNPSDSAVSKNPVSDATTQTSAVRKSPAKRSSEGGGSMCQQTDTISPTSDVSVASSHEDSPFCSAGFSTLRRSVTTNSNPGSPASLPGNVSGIQEQPAKSSDVENNLAESLKHGLESETAAATTVDCGPVPDDPASSTGKTDDCSDTETLDSDSDSSRSLTPASELPINVEKSDVAEG